MMKFCWENFMKRSDDTKWEIDEILKTRIINKKKEYFVSWKNYPKSFNSWVKEKDMQ